MVLIEEVEAWPETLLLIQESHQG